MPDDPIGNPGAAPSNGGAAPGADGTNPSSDEPRFTQAQLEQLIGKRLRNAQANWSKELREKFEVTSDEELADLVARGRTVEPPKKSPQEREAEKLRKALEDRDAEHAKQIAAIAAERDAERIQRMLLPVLSDARDPDAALLVIKHKTGIDFGIRDGKPVVLDKDGDSTGDDPVKWLTETIKREEFRYLLKPSVSGGDGGQKRSGKASPPADDLPAIDIRRRGGLAAIAELRRSEG